MNFKPAAESNTAGFFTNDTCFMPLIAMPASKRPGLRVLRGSLLLGYVCAATMVGTTVVASSRMEPRIIRIEVYSGGGDVGRFTQVHSGGRCDSKRLMMPIS